MVATNIAIACQGGGSHAAYAAGVLPALLPQFANAALAQAPGADAGPPGSLNLIGISGTSGGAITALLAWYGFLVGGPDAASRKLEAFWNANCAQWPGEELWNTSAVGWANALDYDLKFSPYRAPLRTFESWTTTVWPAVAHVLGQFNRWMRADFFQLDALIRPHVDFGLVAALGAFCSIPQEVERWLSIELETRSVEAPPEHRRQLYDARQRIERRIAEKLAARRDVELALDASRVPRDALLRLALARWREPPCAFEAEPLRALAEQVLGVTRELPQLLIGSVRIDDGAFTAFSSERPPREGGISLASVLASAALPWLFEAQRISQFDPDRNEERTDSYWDGLFSQNPPIKNFMSGVADPAKKPDGIWIVQVNPEHFDTASGAAGEGPGALSGNALWPTRDALSGNLSLNQEVAFVEAINRRIDADGSGRSDDKHIAVHRIVMDGAAVARKLGRPLGVASKFDRSARLEAALLAHGHAQGERFLALRAAVQAEAGSRTAALPATGAAPQPFAAPAGRMEATPAAALLATGLGRQSLAAPAGSMAAMSAPALSATDLAPQPLAVPGGWMAATPAAALHATGPAPGERAAPLVVDGITVHREAGGGGGEPEEPLASVRWHALGTRPDGGAPVRLEGRTGLFAAGPDGLHWRLCGMNASVAGRGRSTQSPGGGP